MSRRPEAKWGGVWILFAAFITLCGTTHLASIVTVWYPAYYVEGLFKFATAIVSVITAVALWLLIPHAMTVPARRDIETRNEEIECLNHQLQQRIGSLTTLAGGVSHDFNNMLTIIQGHAQLLEQSDLVGRTADEH
ncbi:MAG: hypothetical protein U5O39_02490 [Gammaproteobacteria bacterium]|nr:hypothetical protein [Gammaproteobacteria bacterium]